MSFEFTAPEIKADVLIRLYKNHLTTPDIKASVEDLRVLGKKDFKNLLKYRIAVREDVSNLH